MCNRKDFSFHVQRCDMFNEEDGTGTEYWDDEQQVPYTISTEGSEWIGHEDTTSVTLKVPRPHLTESASYESIPYHTAAGKTTTTTSFFLCSVEQH